MRRIGLILILLSGGVSILWGFFLERSIDDGMLDFKVIYYGERCLLQHHDPYQEGEPLRAYQADGNCPQLGAGLRDGLTWYLYLPPTLIFLAPLAMLPWGSAHLLWMFLTAGSLILAALLTWDLAKDYSPGVSLFLICFVLANSELLLATGNPAGIVVGFCVAGVWCIFKERFIFAGVLCLALSLAIKPHDAGLVWLFFLLAGGLYRKRALQSLLFTVLLGLFGLIWVSQISPHWMGELHSNLQALSAQGRNIDPRPTNPVYKSGPSMIINLQSTLSAFWEDPRIYNPVSFLVCGALLLPWAVRTLRSKLSRPEIWLALATVIPITMLVSYHRPYDAKLLLLTVPACAMLWAKDGPLRWIVLVINSAGIILTQDIPLAILDLFSRGPRMRATGLWGRILVDLLLRPTPLILLLMGMIYLWVYLRREPERG